MGAPRLNPEAATTRSAAAEASWFTPREVARQRRVRVSTILGWIRRGELEAINHADTRLGKPRWKISTHALATFDASRSSRSVISPPTRRQTRPPSRRGITVTEYFE